MFRRWILPLVLIVATVGVVAATWSNSSPSDIPFLPKTTSHRSHWTFGEDGSTTLPDYVKFASSNGIITTVVTTDDVPHREPWSDLIATRYSPGDLNATDVTRQLWRTVDLKLEKTDGSIAELEVARPLWWFEQTGAKVGATIDLAMYEVGIEGEARVLRIGPCDADSRENSPKSAIVIGTIKHENAIVLDLVFNGDTNKPLGVTANHPIYSEDRNDWIAAGELEINENMRTVDGSAALTAKSKRAGRETVYNLEVHRAHSYYVSHLGILAHNTGIGCELKVVKHGDMPTPRLGNESHHGVMSAWMKRNFADYNPNKAPAVLMPQANHNATRGVYNTWRAEMRQKMGGTFDWGKVSQADMRALSDKMFDAAAVPQKIRAEYRTEFEKMINVLGG